MFSNVVLELSLQTLKPKPEQDPAQEKFMKEKPKSLKNGLVSEKGNRNKYLEEDGPLAILSPISAVEKSFQSFDSSSEGRRSSVFSKVGSILQEFESGQTDYIKKGDFESENRARSLMRNHEIGKNFSLLSPDDSRARAQTAPHGRKEGMKPLISPRPHATFSVHLSNISSPKAQSNGASSMMYSPRSAVSSQTSFIRGGLDTFEGIFRAKFFPFENDISQRICETVPKAYLESLPSIHEKEFLYAAMCQVVDKIDFVKIFNNDTSSEDAMLLLSIYGIIEPQTVLDQQNAVIRMINYVNDDSGDKELSILFIVFLALQMIVLCDEEDFVQDFNLIDVFVKYLKEPVKYKSLFYPILGTIHTLFSKPAPVCERYAQRFLDYTQDLKLILNILNDLTNPNVQIMLLAYRILYQFISAAPTTYSHLCAPLMRKSLYFLKLPETISCAQRPHDDFIYSLLSFMDDVLYIHKKNPYRRIISQQDINDAFLNENIVSILVSTLTMARKCFGYFSEKEQINEKFDLDSEQESEPQHDISEIKGAMDHSVTIIQLVLSCLLRMTHQKYSIEWLLELPILYELRILLKYLEYSEESLKLLAAILNDDPYGHSKLIYEEPYLIRQLMSVALNNYESDTGSYHALKFLLDVMEGLKLSKLKLKLSQDPWRFLRVHLLEDLRLFLVHPFFDTRCVTYMILYHIGCVEPKIDTVRRAFTKRRSVIAKLLARSMSAEYQIPQKKIFEITNMFNPRWKTFDHYLMNQKSSLRSFPVCDYCAKMSSENHPLLVCSQCSSRLYCDEKCQQKHLSAHKRNCDSVRSRKNLLKKII